jgi:ATP-dependent protease Clp ATPase subunit
LEAKHTIYCEGINDTWTDVPTSLVAETLTEARKLGYPVFVRVDCITATDAGYAGPEVSP